MLSLFINLSSAVFVITLLISLFFPRLANSFYKRGSCEFYLHKPLLTPKEMKLWTWSIRISGFLAKNYTEVYFWKIFEIFEDEIKGTGISNDFIIFRTLRSLDF